MRASTTTAKAAESPYGWVKMIVSKIQKRGFVQYNTTCFEHLSICCPSAMNFGDMIALPLVGSDAEKHLNDPMVIAKLQEVGKVGR